MNIIFSVLKFCKLLKKYLPLRYFFKGKPQRLAVRVLVARAGLLVNAGAEVQPASADGAAKAGGVLGCG